MAMPQIWMTYEELAALLDCTVMEACERVQLERLDRKISRDGQRRAKLSREMIGVFIERIRGIDYGVDRAVDDLQLVHGLSRGPAGQKRLEAPRSRQTG
jgi:hypothetical protein